MLSAEVPHYSSGSADCPSPRPLVARRLASVAQAPMNVEGMEVWSRDQSVPTGPSLPECLALASSFIERQLLARGSLLGSSNCSYLLPLRPRVATTPCYSHFWSVAPSLNGFLNLPHTFKNNNFISILKLQLGWVIYFLTGS